jgi:hypothetical protein
MYGQHDCGTHSKGDAVKYLFALILVGLPLAGSAIADDSEVQVMQQIQQETVRELQEAPGPS